MFRLALKNVRHNPRRLILTAIAVALGVGLVSATHIFTNSLYNGIDASLGDTYDSVAVIVTPEGEEKFSQSDVSTLAAIEGIDHASGALTDPLQGKLFGPNGESAGSDFGPPDLFWAWTGIPSIDGAEVTEGRAPAAAGEIMLSTDAADAVDATVGDTVEVAAIDGRFPTTVVGIMDYGEDQATFGARFSVLTLDDLTKIGGPTTGFSQLLATATPGSEEAALAAATAAFPGTTVQSGPDYAQAQIDDFGSFLTYVDIFTLAFAFISVFVGAYIIVNTFRILVTQRTRELGLLRAIGATGEQVRRMVLLEAFIVSVISSVVGVLIGWLLAFVVVGGLGLLGLKGAFGNVTIPLDAWVWGLATGILITLVSALLPAITASRISPMEALRDQSNTVRRGLRRRNIVGSTLAIVGAGAIGVGLYAGPPRPYLYVAAGAVALVLGITLLAAQILVPVAVSLRGALVRLWKVDGRLATKNIERESRRSANTAAALMIGVLLLALTATFTESIKGLVREQVSGLSTADFFVAGAPIPMPDGLIESITAVEGVDQASAIGFVEQVTTSDTPVALAVLDPATAEEAWSFTTQPPVAEIGGNAYASNGFVEAGHEVGDTIELVGPDGVVEVTIIGTVGANVDADLVVSWDTAAELSNAVLLAQVGVTVEEGASEAEVEERLSAMLTQDYPLLIVTTPQDILGVVDAIVNTILAVLYALLAGAIVIAILGVANTLSLSVTERTREIGLLRAVGMSRRSVRRIIRIEAIVMSLLGAILGSVLGVGLGIAIIRALNEFGFTVIAVPWVQLAAFTVLAIVAGILAAIMPALRASRLDILQAIAADG
jgi:putative ABC transport system permease protein